MYTYAQVHTYTDTNIHIEPLKAAAEDKCDLLYAELSIKWGFRV